jgi:hypothetical protein
MPHALLAAVLSFIGMLILQEVGRRVGHRSMARDPEGARAGVGAVDGAVFALLGRLVAFTFSGAASRFDARRQLVVEGANAIGTAYLRIDVLPPDLRPALRDKFRLYVDARLGAYQELPDIAAAKEGLARAAVLQGSTGPGSATDVRPSPSRSARCRSSLVIGQRYCWPSALFTTVSASQSGRKASRSRV